MYLDVFDPKISDVLMIDSNKMVFLLFTTWRQPTLFCGVRRGTCMMVLIVISGIVVSVHIFLTVSHYVTVQTDVTSSDHFYRAKSLLHYSSPTL